MKNILVTGAFGLVGSDLVPALQKKYGASHVFALGNKTIPKDFDGQLVKGDVRELGSLARIVKKHHITEVYHLAGLLSVGGEKNPELAWDVNMNGLRNVLELARRNLLGLFYFLMQTHVMHRTSSEAQAPNPNQPTRMPPLQVYFS